MRSSRYSMADATEAAAASPPRMTAPHTTHPEALIARTTRMRITIPRASNATRPPVVSSMNG